MQKYEYGLYTILQMRNVSHTRLSVTDPEILESVEVLYSFVTIFQKKSQFFISIKKHKTSFIFNKNKFCVVQVFLSHLRFI